LQVVKHTKLEEIKEKSNRADNNDGRYDQNNKFID